MLPFYGNAAYTYYVSVCRKVVMDFVNSSQSWSQKGVHFQHLTKVFNTSIKSFYLPLGTTYNEITPMQTNSLYNCITVLLCISWRVDQDLTRKKICIQKTIITNFNMHLE